MNQVSQGPRFWPAQLRLRRAFVLPQSDCLRDSEESLELAALQEEASQTDASVWSAVGGLRISGRRSIL